jgi:hypothetical protein
LLLKATFKGLRRVTLCPWRIGAITAAALVPAWRGVSRIDIGRPRPSTARSSTHPAVQPPSSGPRSARPCHHPDMIVDHQALDL